MRASKAPTGEGRGEGMQRCRSPSRPPLSCQHTCCRGRSSRVPVVPLRCSLCCCSLVVRGVGPEGLEVTPHQLGVAVHRNQVLPHHICSRTGGRPNPLLSGPCCDSGFRADTLHGRPLRPCQSHAAVHAKLLGPEPSAGPLVACQCPAPAHHSQIGSLHRWPGCTTGCQAP